jgi:predicted HTH domain antitoxin
MCDIMEQLMEKRCREELIELAKKAIAEGDLSLEKIADLFKLPLSTIQELASSMSESKQE